MQSSKEPSVIQAEQLIEKLDALKEAINQDFSDYIDIAIKTNIGKDNLIDDKDWKDKLKIKQDNERQLLIEEEKRLSNESLKIRDKDKRRNFVAKGLADFKKEISYQNTEKLRKQMLFLWDGMITKRQFQNFQKALDQGIFQSKYLRELFDYEKLSTHEKTIVSLFVELHLAIVEAKIELEKIIDRRVPEQLADKFQKIQRSMRLLDTFEPEETWRNFERTAPDESNIESKTKEKETKLEGKGKEKESEDENEIEKADQTENKKQSVVWSSVRLNQREELDKEMKRVLGALLMEEEAQVEEEGQERERKLGLDTQDQEQERIQQEVETSSQNVQKGGFSLLNLIISAARGIGLFLKSLLIDDEPAPSTPSKRKHFSTSDVKSEIKVTGRSRSKAEGTEPKKQLATKRGEDVLDDYLEKLHKQRIEAAAEGRNHTGTFTSRRRK